MRGRSGAALGPPNMYTIRASGCICGKQMIDRNLGWCFWCGHGEACAEVEQAYRRVMEHDEHPEFAGPARVLTLIRPNAQWNEDRCVSAYYAWLGHFGLEPQSEDWQRAKHPEEPTRPSYMTVLRLFGGWEGFKQYIAEIPRDQVAVA